MPQTRAIFRQAVLRAIPFTVMIVPFGALFGLLATAQGLSVFEAMAFSVVVIAGSSQFAALQMMQDGAPLLVVILTATAVNLRMAMYSASMVPWLGPASPGQKRLIAYLLIDQTYALSLQHYEKHPRLSISQRVAYFLGASVSCCLPWVVASAVGYLLGRAIPEGLALDFALPITFLAMIGPMLRTPAHMAAALVSIVASLVFAFLPSGLGLFVAAPLAMLTGAWVETVTERRRGMGA